MLDMTCRPSYNHELIKFIRILTFMSHCLDIQLINVTFILPRPSILLVIKDHRNLMIAK